MFGQKSLTATNELYRVALQIRSKNPRVFAAAGKLSQQFKQTSFTSKHSTVPSSFARELRNLCTTTRNSPSTAEDPATSTTVETQNNSQGSIETLKPINNTNGSSIVSANSTPQPVAGTSGNGNGEEEEEPLTFQEATLMMLRLLMGMIVYAVVVGGCSAIVTHQSLTKWNAYHTALRLLWDGERVFDELDEFCESVDELSHICLEFLGESPQEWEENLARQQEITQLQRAHARDQEPLQRISDGQPHPRSHAHTQALNKRHHQERGSWLPGWLSLFHSDESSPTAAPREFRFEWWRLRQQVRSLHDVKVRQLTQELRSMHREGITRIQEVRDEVPKWTLLMGWGEEDLYRGMQQVASSLTRLRVLEAETRALINQIGEDGFEDMWRLQNEASLRVAARRQHRFLNGSELDRSNVTANTTAQPVRVQTLQKDNSSSHRLIVAPDAESGHSFSSAGLPVSSIASPADAAATAEAIDMRRAPCELHTRD